MLNLFVQVAYDLIDPERKHYDDMVMGLAQRNLSRSVLIPGRGRLQMPRNTFAGIHNCYSSPEHAVQAITQALKDDGLYGDVSGHAFVTASVLSETAFSEVHFGMLAPAEMN